ncbi:fibroblast growth factor receptor 4-like [Liolophura sinensis]|uniref:fibroblast growth factor receptor 4-like n=1 Tax=Liolophura sinensis TaxID=3198878 RepID=UPI00315944B8
MKLQLITILLTLVLTSALLVSMATAKRGSRKSKKRDDPELPSWKPKSNPAKGDAVFSKKAGQKLLLKCPADGNPKPKVRWLKNGEPIPKSPTGRIKEKKFNLLVSDLQVSDSGNYTCEVYNKVGEIKWTYIIRIMKVIWPLEVVGPENKTVYEGEDVNFRCRVMNDPEAQIQWLRRTLGQGKANTTKLESEKQMFIPTGEDPELLVLKNVSLGDSGLYKCLVGNFNGLKYSDAWLNVLPRNKSTPTTEKTKRKKEKQTIPTFAPVQTTTTMMRIVPVTYTVYTTQETHKKRPDKNRKLTTVTDAPRQRRPKLTSKPNQDNGRGRGSKRKPISPLYTPLMTMTPKTRSPKRKDMMKNKKEKTTVLEHDPREKTETTDKPNVYNMPTMAEEKPTNEDGADKAVADSSAGSPGSINLWTVYIIVGAVAGGILLIGLVTLIVAVACARREDGPLNKSTTV